ncbi:MAG: alpha/beta hydrolase [Chloroflexi bacterium]|nr:alpha/beta hydrolase [Chloroflexota bacterium]
MPEAAGLFYEHRSGGPSATGRPPLVLIHGAGGARLYWPPKLRRLQGWAVYALDLPGHGDSPGPGQSTIIGYRQAIEAWADGLGLPPVVAVGHSMGGAIALSLALDAPARVAGLVLVGTGARLRVHPMLLEATCLDDAGAEVLMSAWYSSASSPRMRDLAARSLQATDFAVLHGDFMACDGFDVMDRLGAIGQRALVVVGENDQMTPVKYARYLADHMGRAWLEIVPGAGHMVMLEQPAAVEKILTDWLAGIFLPG